MASSDPLGQARLLALVGDPSEKAAALRTRIQNTNVQTFAEIEGDFLDFLWTVDTYRVAQVVPPAPVGVTRSARAASGEGVYRGKGNVFSDVVALILSNRTSRPLASRRDVQGFSQLHQIDVAWPARSGPVILDPLVCCEAKLTGAPGVGGKRDRGGTDDWSNRRKELKFQATDLKLFRQQQSTHIYNWEAWRREAPPLVFVLWAARVANDTEYPRMIQEASFLRDTYLDGVGIFGFRPTATLDGYEPVPAPKNVPGRITSLDSVLSVISAKIEAIVREHGGIPGPELPASQAVDAAALADSRPE